MVSTQNIRVPTHAFILNLFLEKSSLLHDNSHSFNIFIVFVCFAFAKKMAFFAFAYFFCFFHRFYGDDGCFEIGWIYAKIKKRRARDAEIFS